MSASAHFQVLFLHVACLKLASRGLKAYVVFRMALCLPVCPAEPRTRILHLIPTSPCPCCTMAAISKWPPMLLEVRYVDGPAKIELHTIYGTACYATNGAPGSVLLADREVEAMQGDAGR